MAGRWYGLALALATLGALASVLAAVRVGDAWRDDQAARAELRARQFAGAVDQRLDRAVMWSEILADFVATVDRPLSREEFTGFGGQLIETSGFMRAAAWIPRVPPDPGRPAPSGGAERYVVRYRVPEPADPSVYGQDLAASADRAPALRRALATGDPAATGALRFYTDGRTGAAVYRAVYRPGADLATEAARLAAVEGIVGVGLETDIVLGMVAAIFPLRDFRTRLIAEGETLADLPASTELAGQATSLLRIPIQVAGADWEMEMALPPAPAGWPPEAWQALLGGLLATLLASAGLWIVGRRAEATDLRLADLAGAERRLRNILEGAPFPAMVRTDGGAVLEVNRAWLDGCGHDRSDIADLASWNALAFGGPHGPLAPVGRLHELDRPVDEGEHEVRTATGAARLWAFRSAPVGIGAEGARLALTMAADLTERREAEAHLRRLMGEVDHRARNALAVVQAIVHLSRADGADPATFAETVENRVHAVARAHSLLAESRWSGASLRRMIEDELAASPEGSVVVDRSSPAVSIRPEATQTVSIVLHELTTNALKYGALSQPGGRLSIGWTIDPDGGLLTLDWSEAGGAAIDGPPKRTGFGLQFLRQSVEGQLRGSLSLDWRRGGLVVGLRLPADTWTAAGPAEARGPEAGPAVRSIRAPAPAMARHVLLVEDESLTALALRQALEGAGFEVHGPAARLEDALRLAGSVGLDAAVLDVNLFGAAVTPVADALAARGVPFVFCTGYEAAFAAGGAHGAAPVLSKPVQIDRLIGTLREIIAAAPRAA